MSKLVLLSGPLAVGKTEFSGVLIKRYSFGSIRTGSYLKGLAEASGASADRTSMQELGDSLDLQTDYRWVVDAVAKPQIDANADVTRWLFDSVRKKRQIEHFRSMEGMQVTHIHLNASEKILRERYNERASKGHDYAGNVEYSVAIRHPNEASSRSLIEFADLVIDASTKSSEQLGTEVVEFIHQRRA